MTDGKLNIGFENIIDDKEVNHSTEKTNKSELEKEIRYFLDRHHQGWVFVNYQFGNVNDCIFN